MDKPTKPTKVKTNSTPKVVQIEVTKGQKKQIITTSEGGWNHVIREVVSLFGVKEKSIKFFTWDGKRVDPSSFPLSDGLKLVLSEGGFVKPEIATAPVLFEEFITVPPSNLQHGAIHILPFLYLGSLYTAREEAYLKTLQVKYVLNAAHDLENFFPSSFSYCNIDIQDKEGSNILQYFKTSNQFIETARTTNSIILVHCRGGISRSVTLILAYLMWKYSLPLKKALQYMKARKPSVNPNRGFFEQLQKYEVSL